MSSRAESSDEHESEKQGIDKRASGLPSGFRLLLVGEAFSFFGSSIAVVVLPLIAIINLQSGEFAMGTLSAAGWLPVVLLGLIAGSLVDRTSKWHVMLICNLTRLAAFGAIPLLAVSGQMSFTALLLIAFIAGVANVFFDIAYQTFVPDLVAAEQLDLANSRLELCRSTAQLVGPMIGGALVARYNPAYLTTLNAFTYLIATVTLLILPRAVRGISTRVSSSDSDRRSLLADTRAGIQLVWNSPALRSVVASGGLINIFVSGINALLVIYITRTLGFSSSIVGITFTCAGAGALIGALSYGRWAAKFSEGGCIRAGMTAIALGGILLPLAGLGVLPLLFLLLAQLMVGFGSPVLNIALVTLRQKITPPEMLGRVNASARVSIMSSLPLGALLISALAEVQSVPIALIAAAIGQVLVVLALGPGLSRIRSDQLVY